MLTKEKLLQTIKEMPDQFSIDELIDKVILLQKVELGLEQSKNNQVHSTAEAKKQLKKWLLK